MDYIKRIAESVSVGEILGLVALAQMDDIEVSRADMAKVFKAAESRLILDCNVDLTPYSEDDRP